MHTKITWFTSDVATGGPQATIWPASRVSVDLTNQFYITKTPYYTIRIYIFDGFWNSLVFQCSKVSHQ